MENTVKLLREHKIKPSYIRIKILEHLMLSKEHPSVDEIFLSLEPQIPTLSKTTVYNTLGLLVQKGLASAITIADTEKRFDGDIKEHGHFMCEYCKKVYDFPVDMGTKIAEELEGFYIKEKNVYYKGTCKSCQNKNIEIKRR